MSLAIFWISVGPNCILLWNLNINSCSSPCGPNLSNVNLNPHDITRSGLLWRALPCYQFVMSYIETTKHSIPSFLLSLSLSLFFYFCSWSNILRWDYFSPLKENSHIAHNFFYVSVRSLHSISHDKWVSKWPQAYNHFFFGKTLQSSSSFYWKMKCHWQLVNNTSNKLKCGHVKNFTGSKQVKNCITTLQLTRNKNCKEIILYNCRNNCPLFFKKQNNLYMQSIRK